MSVHVELKRGWGGGSGYSLNMLNVGLASLEAISDKSLNISLCS